MANNIREVKTRIVSTKKTAQITKAMHMVSTSKLKGAERSIKEYRPFIEKVRDIIVNIASSSDELIHPLLEKRPVNKTCYVMIAADKGLAGAFNANVSKELTRQLKKHNSKEEYVIMPLGLRAYTYCKKMNYPMLIDHPVILRDEIDFDDVYNISHDLVLDFMKKDFDEVVVVYNHFVNTLIQEPRVESLFPIDKSAFVDKNKINNEYDFEGGVNEILNVVFPIYIQNYIYGLMLDSKASEHAARMNSMKNATDNAEEVIDSLGLLYNRARQAAITLEITDIVGGASVINEN